MAGYQKQGKNLKGEISLLNDKISKLNLQIQAVNVTLTQLNRKIGDTQSQIEVTEKSIDTRRAALGELIQDLYENQQVSMLEVFLAHPSCPIFLAV